MSLIDNLPKTYAPLEAAPRHAAAWEAAGLFKADPAAPGEPYSIVIPPPNITGSLHMGHALNNTLQDVLIRYKRMDGYNAVWVPGTDHAGISAQWVVERQLRAEGIDRRALGRDEFERRVWAWKELSGGMITRQLRRLGVSCDWSRERFTLDPGLSDAVREVFVRMYEEGLIYRAERLINWDPIGMTALSDLEVVAEEDFQTELWSFAYPLEHSNLEQKSEGSEGEITEIVVATTRPETMLGDTAVAVHPEDPRYKHLIGKFVVHPILHRRIPIVGDAILVDPAFGTGAVKVTPAHDFNDFEVGKRHNLPFITLMNEDGTLNDAAGPYVGMSREEGREAVKAAITELGLFRGSKPHTMALPRSERSGAVVEPMISTQWFVKMAPLARPAIGAVENGFTRFYPEQWANTYYSWMRNIKDWCISRQIWWGHKIPAWHCGQCGHITVSREDPTACAACGSDKIRQDNDVLDTWFSSALWPFSTLGWPERTADLARYYPTSVLVTGFDIIFFWVARMMFSGIHQTGSVPFRDVYIHALVRDEEGQKMSKTKGNVVDPLDAIDRHGADAFRMTLVALAAQGRDVLWSEKRVDGYVKFQNKVWQAFRFLAIHADKFDADAPRTLSPYDHWILARAGEAVRRVRAALDSYRFNEAASEIYQFTWSELCDWYVELSKPVLYSEDDEAGAQGARYTLINVFNMLIRLLHPIMPFLSEELWQHLPGATGSVCVAPFPKAADYPSDPAALAEVALLQGTIIAVRQIRADMEIAPKQPLTLVLAQPAALQKHAGALASLANIVQISEGGRTGFSATAIAGGVELHIPLDGILDPEAERVRLRKVLQKSASDAESLDRRLSAPGFTDRAPPAVVQEFQEKLDAARARIEKLTAALAALGD